MRFLDASRVCGAGYASPDQAYHLAGFGPACARKATIAERWLDKVIGHGVGGGRTSPDLLTDV